MNRNQPYRRSRRDRYEGDYSRQSEQFADSDSDFGEAYRGYDQMGEGGSRGGYGEADDGGYGSSYSRGGSGSDRNRGGYNRQRDDDRQRGEYSERGEGYSSGGFGRSSYTNQERRGFGSFTGNDFGGGDFSGPRQNYGPGRSPADQYGPYGGSTYGEGTYGAGSFGRSGGDRYSGSSGGGGAGYATGGRDRGSSRGDRDDERGFFERAGDEVASWFGDEEAARRREQDHSGRGPANYRRSDERILEDACDRLTDDWGVDASNIQVTVQNNEVTLDGTVSSRQQKRRAEDCVQDLSGVKHVQNNLRVTQGSSWDRNDGDETSRGTQDTTSGTLA